MTNEEKRKMVIDATKGEGPMAPKQCLICRDGNSPMWCGIFMPNREFMEKIKVPEEKTRVVVYGLCADCMKLEDKMERVEQIVLAYEKAKRS